MKDTYTVDLESNEKLYWLGTESGLLGSLGFEGACTVGDGSYDPPTSSMGEGFFLLERALNHIMTISTFFT